MDELSGNLAYADRFVRSAIQNGRRSASDAILALNMWMYAAHLLYKGMDTCQKKTDADNPDIYLLLGKSHYQLGNVEQAIASWKTTLRLAPKQAYAKRMIANLQGTNVDVKTRLAIASALLPA